jgi:hypothetical protein
VCGVWAGKANRESTEKVGLSQRLAKGGTRRAKPTWAQNWTQITCFRDSGVTRRFPASGATRYTGRGGCAVSNKRPAGGASGVVVIVIGGSLVRQPLGGRDAGLVQ